MSQPSKTVVLTILLIVAIGFLFVGGVLMLISSNALLDEITHPPGGFASLPSHWQASALGLAIGSVLVACGVGGIVLRYVLSRKSS